MGAIKLYKEHAVKKEDTFLKVITDKDCKLSGNLTNIKDTSYYVIAVAYPAGDYKGLEVKGYRSSKEPFVDAADISIINSNWSQFSLQLQQEGDYELYFASFIDPDNDGELQFSGMLDVSSTFQKKSKQISSSFGNQFDVSLTIEGIF